MANHSDSRRTRRTASPPACPARTPAAGTALRGTPASRSGPGSGAFDSITTPRKSRLQLGKRGLAAAVLLLQPQIQRFEVHHHGLAIQLASGGLTEYIPPGACGARL